MCFGGGGKEDVGVDQTEKSEHIYWDVSCWSPEQ